MRKHGRQLSSYIEYSHLDKRNRPEANEREREEQREPGFGVSGVEIKSTGLKDRPQWKM